MAFEVILLSISVILFKSALYESVMVDCAVDSDCGYVGRPGGGVIISPVVASTTAPDGVVIVFLSEDV